MPKQNYFKKDLEKIKPILEKIPKKWNGKEAVLEMKNSGDKNWKQMEWPGFYFQFLCEKFLSHILKMQQLKYGNVLFDGLGNIPWDFKTHAINTSSHQIIVNDSQATAQAVKKYGQVGLILALGEVIYNDEKRSFQKWHKKLKGSQSKFELTRIQRGAWSRLRKTLFNLKQICFIKITDETLIKCGSFQTNFRNSDGSSRRSKILIDLEKIKNELVEVIEFNE